MSLPLQRLTLQIWSGILALSLTSIAASQTLYESDFTTLDGWTISGSVGDCGFAADASPANLCGTPYVSAPSSLNFNDGVSMSCGSQFASATSPIIDLTAVSSTTATLSCWTYFDTLDPGWDTGSFVVRDAATKQQFVGAVSLGCGWQYQEITLDPAWGEIELHASIYWDGFDFGPAAGLFIDDVRVSGADPSYEIECVGDTSTQTGGRVYLLPSGSQVASDNAFALAGAEFPAGSFTQAFYGASPGVIQFSSGTRCIAAPNSYRLGVLPTGAVGRPFWEVDLPDPANFSAPILAGSTWYFQSVYRDGAEFRFSDSIQVTFE